MGMRCPPPATGTVACASLRARARTHARALERSQARGHSRARARECPTARTHICEGHARVRMGLQLVIQWRFILSCTWKRAARWSSPAGFRYLRWLWRRAHALARSVRRGARLNPHAALGEKSHPEDSERFVEDPRSVSHASARGHAATGVTVGAAAVAAATTAARAM